jgi:ectoine hydroxylase-related dioxygenase (phytanoyl-CoA dioxygenase family)
MSVTSMVASTGRLIVGGAVHAVTGRTPPSSYQSLIRLFCQTGGASTEYLNKFIALRQPPYAIPEPTGLLGRLGAAELSSIQANLDDRGYHVFKERLPDDLCDRLVAFAKTTRCKVRAPSQPGLASKEVAVDRYEPTALIGTRYDFLAQDLIDQADVQRVMGDATFLAVAQAYLRSKPILDVVAMWWQAAFSDRPDAEAAQYFHFDMDRIKWLKFFIYLTDVEPENGPHCFVAGSHRTGGIPKALLEKGYARLTDEEVAAEYSKDKFIEFSAPRGTIIAEDTRGLHKGKHVERGDRLLLQLQFSNSLFGGYYPPVRAKTILDPDLKTNVDRYPFVYSNYIERPAR